MSEKKIDLIAQLLAKAESTTPEEAEALVEHAERLMIKYAIDQSVIDERRAKKGEASEKIIEQKFEFTGAYRGELINLAFRVASGLGNLRVMQYTGGTGKVFTCWVVGFESDVAQAKLLIESLQVQAAVAVRAYWKLSKDLYVGESSYVQEKARRSFVAGFGDGAGARIRDSRNKIVSEIATGTALVLVNRKDRVDAYMGEKNLRSSRGRNIHGDASGAGFQAGQQANTGEKSVSGKSRGIEA